MRPTITLITQIEERGDGWWVTCLVNDEPGATVWGPFATASVASGAAKTILADMRDDLERMKSDMLAHIRGLIQ